MKTIRFGIIGAGLMAREFASATARWCHLNDSPARPEIMGVCDQNPAGLEWFRTHFPSIKHYVSDYRELLALEEVEAVYAAVPHNLHQEIYGATIRSGKHLMGEKPFGIDLPANTAILRAIQETPASFVRCSSQFPFFPAMQRMGKMIVDRAFGQIIEANTGFLHSSDLDPDKPINWKRMIEFNGEYGVMGDLGMHACHVPFRAGWRAIIVRAILSNIIPERPDGKGGMAPCHTWDNATLLCETRDPEDGTIFPWVLKTQRIAPGQKDTWYAEVLGTKACARWSSTNPNVLQVLEYTGGEQSYRSIETGYTTAFKTITGPNFEFGFTDSILQMWAAFIHELAAGSPPSKFAGCATPDDAHLSHQLFTAALESAKLQQTIAIP